MPGSERDKREHNNLEQLSYPGAPPSYIQYAPPSFDSSPHNTEQEKKITDQTSLSFCDGKDSEAPTTLDAAQAAPVQVEPERKECVTLSSIVDFSSHPEKPDVNVSSHEGTSAVSEPLISSEGAVEPSPHRDTVTAQEPNVAYPGDHGIPESVRASLRRLASIRMKALRYRAAEREENMLIRNLHKHVLRELYVFLSAIEKVKQTMPSDVAQDIGDWDDYLVNIEEYIEESEAAGQRSDRKHAELNTVEWDLYQGEEDIYKPPGVLNTTQAIDENEELRPNGWGSSATSPDPEDKKRNLLDGDQLINDFLALSKPALEYDLEHEGDETENDEPEYDMLSDVNGGFELFGNEFSQFADKNFANWNERKASIVLERHFPGKDIEWFTRWLLHGQPWNDRFDTATAAPRSAIEAVCRWVWEHLNLLTSGVNTSAQNLQKSSSQMLDHDFAEFKSFFIRTWLGDLNLGSHGQDEAKNEELQENAMKLGHRDCTTASPAVDDKDRAVQVRPDDDVSPGDNDTTATNSAHSRHKHSNRKSDEYFIEKSALSEQLDTYVGKSDFPGHTTKLRRGSAS